MKLVESTSPSLSVSSTALDFAFPSVRSFHNSGSDSLPISPKESSRQTCLQNGLISTNFFNALLTKDCPMFINNTFIT